MLTVSRQDEDLFDALRAGASGYLLKGIDEDAIGDALQRVLAGEATLPGTLVARLVDEFRDREQRRIAVPDGQTARLTGREWDVLELMRKGASTAEISERLFVSPTTVRSHVSAILRKLGVPNREAADQTARRRLSRRDGIGRRRPVLSWRAVTSTRIESDSMGEIEVPADRYWGAQTQRSLHHFDIGTETMPKPLIRAFGILKGASASVNRDLGKLDDALAGLDAAGGGGGGQGRARRPLPAAHLADRQRHADQHERQRGHLEPGHRARRRGHGLQEAHPPQRPRQHVAVVERHVPDRHAHRRGRGDRAPAAPVGRGPARRALDKEIEFAGVTKIGRTHLMDAVPLTLGQEFSGYVAQLTADIERIERTLPGLYELAAGGTRRGHRAQHAPRVRRAGGEGDRRRRPACPS